MPNTLASGSRTPAKRSPRIIALVFSWVCALCFIGLASWLLTVRDSPRVLLSLENKVGIWLLILCLGALAIWYLKTAILLLVELRQVSLGGNKLLLEYWFLGQSAVESSTTLSYLFRSRVLRFGEGEERLERVQVAHAS